MNEDGVKEFNREFPKTYSPSVHGSIILESDNQDRMFVASKGCGPIEREIQNSTNGS